MIELKGELKYQCREACINRDFYDRLNSYLLYHENWMAYLQNDQVMVTMALDY